MTRRQPRGAKAEDAGPSSSPGGADGRRTPKRAPQKDAPCRRRRAGVAAAAASAAVAVAVAAAALLLFLALAQRIGPPARPPEAPPFPARRDAAAAFAAPSAAVVIEEGPPPPAPRPAGSAAALARAGPEAPDALVDRRGRTHSASRGAFPRGCRWREVEAAPAPPARGSAGGAAGGGGAGARGYRFWWPSPGGGGGRWSGRMPAACTLDGLAVEGAGGGGGGGSGGRGGVGGGDGVAASGAEARDRPPPPPPPPPLLLLTDAGLRTEVRALPTHVEYDRLWYSDGRWYALVDGPPPAQPPSPGRRAPGPGAGAGADPETGPPPTPPTLAPPPAPPSFRATRNVEVTSLRVASAAAFARSVRWRAVPGDTLVLDYAYFVHPTAIGHWWEMMAPLYSLLRRLGERRAATAAAVAAAGGPASAAEADARSRWRRPDQVVLLHLRRSHLMEWVRAVVAVALTGGEQQEEDGRGPGGVGVGVGGGGGGGRAAAAALFFPRGGGPGGRQSRRLELPPILLQHEDPPTPRLLRPAAPAGEEGEEGANPDGGSGGGGGAAPSPLLPPPRPATGEGSGNGARQLHRPLLGARPGEWLVFERALVVRDASVGARRSFETAEDGRAFRSEVYRAHGIDGGGGESEEEEEEEERRGEGGAERAGGGGNGGGGGGHRGKKRSGGGFAPPGPAPRPWTSAEACARGGRLVLFQRKSANRRVANERALLEEVARAAADASRAADGHGAGGGHGGGDGAATASRAADNGSGGGTSPPYCPRACPPPRVRAVEFTPATPFVEQLRELSRASLLVSAHASNLANAPFLRPGSAVLELIQRHWGGWGGMDRAFRDHSVALGDVHHYAWRARGSNETVYRARPRDGARFAHWRSGECVSEACVEAHTEVDLVADVGAVGRLLREALPRAWRDGAGRAEAEMPWPEA